MYFVITTNQVFTFKLSVHCKMMRVIMTGLLMILPLCLAEAGRSRVITTVTHTTQIQHRVVSTDTTTASDSMSHVTEEEEEEVRDVTLKVKQVYNDVVKKEQCTDIPSLGLLQGDTSI